MRNKYNAKPIIVDGIRFASIKEGKRYRELKLLERAKQITQLEIQPRFLLQEGFELNGEHIREIIYVGDFTYEENDKIVVEDTKGYRTEVFNIKRKLFLKRYPEIKLVLL